MGNEKSIATSKSDDANQVSVHLKDTTPRRRINVEMVQNVLLIWLDNHIDENSADYRNTITQLRCTANVINTFTDGEECMQFLENITNTKACMIISGSLGQYIMPRVHNMSQVDSIFIFCNNKKRHEQWAKDWFKVKGVFTEIFPICEALKKAAHQCEENAISISFMTTSNDISKKNLDQLDPTFMYTQILKEILLTIEFEQKHLQEFSDYCHAVFIGNKSELKNIDKLQRKYHKKTPIWWYTYECFLYSMLNRALQLMDMDIIIKMGFFINDLHRHIERLHSEQFSNHQSAKSFIVYRGHAMLKTEFDQMTKTRGGLISFNNFLSTSKNRKISLAFARRVLLNTDMVGILFVMTIDPTKSTTPFASTVDVSIYKSKEDEVLFSMHTIFRIGEIKAMYENHRLFEVELTLISNNDNDLRVLTDCIREETFPDERGWQRLGLLLNKMGQFQKAQQVYEILLEQITDDTKKGIIYERLGIARHNQGEYKEALEFYKKAHKIRQQLLPSNHPDLASSYNNIGVVYYNMGEYEKALSSYEKALEIEQQSLPPNHPDLAKTYIAHGLVYNGIGKYLNAIALYEKALKIQQQSLPQNHPDLGMSYNNIGNVYYKMGDYLKALSSYQKSFEIKKQSLPSNHPDLGGSYNNIGTVYFNMGDHRNARSFYERAVDIGQRSLPLNNSNLQQWKKNLEQVKMKNVLQGT